MIFWNNRPSAYVFLALPWERSSPPSRGRKIRENNSTVYLQIALIAES
jgi:hypothetical protein